MTYRYSPHARSQLHEVMPERALVSWDDFCQRVRAYPVGPLLRSIAAQASATFDGTPMSIDPSGLQPWALAEIAREALAYSNPHRSMRVTHEALGHLHTLYENLEDPFLLEREGDPWSWELRTVYEQLPFQRGLYADLARFAVLFDREFPDTMKVLDRELISELIGTDPATFVSAAFLLTVSTMRNAGIFDTAWLSEPQFKEVIEELPAKDITHTLSNLFAAPLHVVQARARERRHHDPALRRYDPNPLQATPWIHIGETEFLAPSPHFVAHRATLEGVYHASRERWHPQKKLLNTFLQDLGSLVEAYVGEQLHQLTGDVTGERTYGKGGGSKTVDWIAVLDDVVLLVEVKNARVAAPGRLDVSAWTDDVERDVGKAMKQISTTAALINAGNSPLADIPRDRPLRGIVVTSEPHHLINSPIYRQYLTKATIPSVVLSLGTLERAVSHALQSDASEVFATLTNVSEHQGLNVERIMNEWFRETGGGDRLLNPVLDAGWKRLERAAGTARP